MRYMLGQAKLKPWMGPGWELSSQSEPLLGLPPSGEGWSPQEGSPAFLFIFYLFFLYSCVCWSQSRPESED